MGMFGGKGTLGVDDLGKDCGNCIQPVEIDLDLIVLGRVGAQEFLEIGCFHGNPEGIVIGRGQKDVDEFGIEIGIAEAVDLIAYLAFDGQPIPVLLHSGKGVDPVQQIEKVGMPSGFWR
ncbi:MAG: hypothetical protein ACD_75C00975G0004 [uncultured bacterium]|nr:MAG: hypothetical protein ACD_75C00975G0004 [uncultured bacterium]